MCDTLLLFYSSTPSEEDKSDMVGTGSRRVFRKLAVRRAARSELGSHQDNIVAIRSPLHHLLMA